MFILPAKIDPRKLNLEDPDVLRAIEVLQKQQKYNTKFYDFLEKAYDWQKAACNLTEKNKVVGLIAANQVGKSETAMGLTTMHLTGVYPDWYTGKRFKRPTKVMIAGEDWGHNKDVLQEKLFGTSNNRQKKEIGSGMIPRELIDLASIVTERGDEIKKCGIKHSSGGYSQLVFRCYSQGRKAAQGFPADFVVIDEQPDDDFWSEALTRTAATQGKVMCSFTPLMGKTGLVATLLDLKDDKTSAADKHGSKIKQEASWAMVRATWDDVSHMAEEDKQAAIKGYQSFEIDSRVYGMPMIGSGRVYNFDPSEVTYDPKEVTIKDKWRHLIAIDIGHIRDPSAIILAARCPETEVIYIMEEWQGKTTTTKQLAKAIWGVNPHITVMWPSDANRTNLSSDTTVVEQLNDIGVNCYKRPFVNPRGADGKKHTHIAPGINYINELAATGKFKISIECEELIKQMNDYAYDDKGKIKGGNDHLLDAMRYNVMSIIQDIGESLIEDEDEGQEEFFMQYY